MGKIELDKYYTDAELAEYCVAKVKEFIGSENITHWVEPSAGSGAFLQFLDGNFTAFDIKPEHDKVIKQDYLLTDLEYKQGRCVIGNPPFGRGNYTSVKFFKKSISICDYIAFIQPISQLNNNMYMYEFDLVYSEDLGKHTYSGKNVHTCFNIYKRNPIGYNKKPVYDLESVSLKGVARGKSRNDKVPPIYDFSICSFGSIGKLAEYEGQYCQQIYVTVHNSEYKKIVKEIILNTPWSTLYGMTATPKIKHWMIYKRLRECLPKLK